MWDDDNQDKTEEELMAEWEAMAEDEDDVAKDLNQDEIDSLLGVSGEEKKTLQGWKVLVDAKKINYERLPMLEVVFDRLTRLMSTSLRNFTSDNVEVSLKNMSSIRFGQYLDEVALPALIGVFRFGDWGSSGLITVDTSLIYSVVDILLGGRKCDMPSKIEGRPFTTIEISLVEKMIQVMLDDFTRSFEPIAPISFQLERVETNPSFTTIVRPVNACIVVSLGIEVEDRGGNVEFMVPYSSLEPVREKLTQMFMGEKVGQDNIWETHFSQEVWQAGTHLRAVLDQCQLPLDDVLTWKKGSFIPLKAKPQSRIGLFSGEKLVMTGKMGRRNGHMALEIMQNYLKKRNVS